MNSWEKEIIEDRIEKAKSIDFCISNPMSRNEVFSTDNFRYESGSDLKKGLQNYLLSVKETAKNKISGGVLTKSDMGLIKSEISSISEIIEKIDEAKEYRLPSHVVEKIKL